MRGGNIDDPTPPAFFHAGTRCARSVEGRIHVDRNYQVSTIGGKALHRLYSLNTRIVDNNIDRPEFGLDHGDDLVTFGNIGTIVDDTPGISDPSFICSILDLCGNYCECLGALGGLQGVGKLVSVCDGVTGATKRGRNGREIMPPQADPLILELTLALFQLY